MDLIVACAPKMSKSVFPVVALSSIFLSQNASNLTFSLSSHVWNPSHERPTLCQPTAPNTRWLPRLTSKRPALNPTPLFQR